MTDVVGFDGVERGLLGLPSGLGSNLTFGRRLWGEGETTL